MYLLFQETEETYKKRFEDSENLKSMIKLVSSNKIISRIPNLTEKMQEYLNEFVEAMKMNEMCESLISKLAYFIEECRKKYDEKSDVSQISVVAKIIKEISV